MVTTETQLRGITTRAGQLATQQERAKRTAQRTTQQLQVSQPSTNGTYEQDWNVGIQMALTGKGETKVSQRAKEIDQAIRNPRTSVYYKFSPEERAIIDKLALQREAGLTEKQELTTSEMLKSVYGLQKGYIKPSYSELQQSKKEVAYSPDDPRSLIPTGNIQELLKKSGGGDIILTKGKRFTVSKNIIETPAVTSKKVDYTPDYSVNRTSEINSMRNQSDIRAITQFGKNLIYEKESSPKVSFAGQDFTVRYKSEILVKDIQGNIRNATSEEKKVFLKQKEIAQTKDFDTMIEQTPYSELITKAPSYAVIKGARDVGEMFFKGTSNILGTTSKMTPEQLKSGGAVIGETFLWAGFSPLMKTGSYGEAFEQLSPKKKGTQQLLAQNKFSALGEGLDAETKAFNTINKIQNDLVQKKTLGEQLKYLAQLKNQLKDPIAKTNFDKLVVNLKKDGFIKDVVVTIGKTGKPVVQNVPISKIKTTIAYYGNVPEMKNVGLVGAISTSEILTLFGEKERVSPSMTGFVSATPTIPQDNVRFNPLGMESLPKQKERPAQALAPTLKFFQPQVQIPRQEPKLKQPQTPKLEEFQLNLFKQKQINKQRQRPQLRQKSPTRQKQENKTTRPLLFKLLDYKIEQKQKRKEKPVEDLLEIFKKQEGKFVKVGEERGLVRAGRRIKRELFSGLEASAFAKSKKTGEFIPFESLDLGVRFRPSKQKGKGFVVVQKEKGVSGGRLFSFQEKKAIQKSRKKKNFSWFD